MAEGTVNRILILLRHIFNEAIRDESTPVERNPTHGIKLAKPKQMPAEAFLSRAQLSQLLQAAGESENRDMKDIVTVLAGTGLRRDNVLSMKWAWYNEEKGSLQIPASQDKAKSGFTISLAQGVQELLSERKAKALDSEWVFPNPKTGLPYHSCRAAWEKVIERAGLKGRRMHDLRHTFASMLLDSGAGLFDVKEHLAHASINTTLRYAHLAESRQSQTANAAVDKAGIFA